MLKSTAEIFLIANEYFNNEIQIIVFNVSKHYYTDASSISLFYTKWYRGSRAGSSGLETSFPPVQQRSYEESVQQAVWIVCIPLFPVAYTAACITANIFQSQERNARLLCARARSIISLGIINSLLN